MGTSELLTKFWTVGFSSAAAKWRKAEADKRSQTQGRQKNELPGNIYPPHVLKKHVSFVMVSAFVLETKMWNRRFLSIWPTCGYNTQLNAAGTI